jgi:molecular chaperone GrpE
MGEKETFAEEVPRETEREQGTQKETQKAKGKETIVSLKKALAEETAKAEDYLSNWQRTQADFINYKRRTEQDRGEFAKLANAALMLSLLPILDDLERALDNVSDKLRGMTWVDGIELIYRKFKATLEGQGLSEIKAVGETFDPNYHEAVMEVDGEEGKVIEEIQKGYRMNDRVLRPAMVKVGRGAGGAAEATQADIKEANNG